MERFDLECVKRIVTASNKMHHLEPVSFIEAGLGPAIPRNNVAIQLYRHPVSFHAENFHKGGQRKRSGRVGKIPFFPIDMKFHLPRKKSKGSGYYSALRNANFRVEVRPS